MNKNQKPPTKKLRASGERMEKKKKKGFFYAGKFLHLNTFNVLPEVRAVVLLDT